MSVFIVDEDVPCKTKPELFYSDNFSDVRRAQKMCSGAVYGGTQCPRIVECAKAGMDEEYGVWGGLSAPQRYRMRLKVVS